MRSGLLAFAVFALFASSVLPTVSAQGSPPDGSEVCVGYSFTLVMACGCNGFDEPAIALWIWLFGWYYPIEGIYCG